MNAQFATHGHVDVKLLIAQPMDMVVQHQVHGGIEIVLQLTPTTTSMEDQGDSYY